jgi:SNF2 family DNA or RNA helicase
MEPTLDVSVPQYLQDVVATDRYYGTLTYDKKRKSWIINGEPAVVEMAKRLFPGSDGRGAGVARFPANKRTNGDLNWLMMRFPLRVEDESLWHQAHEETVQHVVNRERIYRQPQKAQALRLKAELLGFQQEGLNFLLQNRRALLADEVGLGKTIQSLGFLSTLETYPTLIVVQPHLIRNFKTEIIRFVELPVQNGTNVSIFTEDNIEDSIHAIRGKKPYELPQKSVYIIHYGLLASWQKELSNIGLETIIFDEIQDLRHAGTLKYSAASLLSSQTPNVIGLSGTPIYNHGGEIWNVMNIIDYHCLGDWESFTREWCEGYGNDIIRDPELLGDYLRREGLMLRRRQEDVLEDLPPLRRVVQTIDLDEAMYDSLVKEAIELAIRMDSVENVLERGRMTREIENATRQATGISKAPYVAQFVRLLLEAGETVLLFAYHHAVFDIYGELLKEFKPGRISGRETSKEKDEAIRRFMEGETNLLQISLRAAAGLNLQRAKVVVFGELDWSPAIHSQAEGRAHRMGQDGSVLAYYLVSQTGTDEDIQEALGLKISQFIGLMGDHAESEEDRVLSESAASEHRMKIVEKLKQRGRKFHHHEVNGQ